MSSIVTHTHKKREKDILSTLITYMIIDNCTASQDIISTIEIFAIYVIVDKSQFHIPCDAIQSIKKQSVHCLLLVPTTRDFLFKTRRIN